MPNRYNVALIALYCWACGRRNAVETRAILSGLGYRVNLGQPDRGNTIHGRDLREGRAVSFEV